MKKVLFVIASNMHMGDLAFCHEWIEELGHVKFRFAFLIDHAIKIFVSQKEQIFYFDPANDVRDEVLKTVRTFAPNIVIYASGNGWDLKGFKGGSSHEMLNDEIVNLNIPLLAFDTKEGYPKPFLEEYENHPFFGNMKVPSPTISKHFISLQNSPNNSENPMIKHYKIKNRFLKQGKEEKEKVLLNYGIGKDMKAVLFSIPKGNYNRIISFFYDYYEYLAGLFQSCGSKPVKFIIVTSENIKCFDSCSNVVQVQHLPYNQYHLLLKSSDLVLSDTFWSTSIALAAFVGIPSVLLCNTHVSKKEKTQKSNDIHWSDFCQKLNLDGIQSREIKHLINCHKDKFNKLCHSPAEGVSLSPFEYLNNNYADLNPKPSDDTIIQELLNFLSNHKMAGTNENYLKLHDIDKSMATKKIIEILTGKQKQTFQKWNIQSLLDIDTGYDSFKKSLSDLIKKCSEPKKAYFRPDNLYPYKIFPYGMVDISNYLIAQFHFKECFVENEVFDKENFSQKISDILFNERVYQPVIEKCKEFQARYDNIPSPPEIVEEVLSQKD